MVETKKIPIYRTIITELETSKAKNERVSSVIEEWQQIANQINQFMPAVGPTHPTDGKRHWRTQDSTLFHMVKNEVSDHNLRAHDAYQAAYTVGEMWGSRYGNQHNGTKPTFGDGNYARFCSCCSSNKIVENDRGYGLKVGLRPYNPEWFHIKPGWWQYKHLDEFRDGEWDVANFELHLKESGCLNAHISLKKDVEVYKPKETDTVVSVDIGERKIHAAAVVSKDDVLTATSESGKEFRRVRDDITESISEMYRDGNLRKVKKNSGYRERYTKKQLEESACSIVSLAKEYEPCYIVLEDLTGQRQNNPDPIHDWPYAKHQEKIVDAANEEGIGVEKITPRDSSITCSKCGHVSEENRESAWFDCLNCDYENCSDVNAAIVLGKRELNRC